MIPCDMVYISSLSDAYRMAGYQYEVTVIQVYLLIILTRKQKFFIACTAIGAKRKTVCFAAIKYSNFLTYGMFSYLRLWTFHGEGAESEVLAFLFKLNSRLSV